MSLLWDRGGLAEHRRLIARLPRCAECGVVVPLPTSGGDCLYCLRRGESLGATITPIRPAARDSVPLPVPDAEGSLPVS